MKKQTREEEIDFLKSIVEDIKLLRIGIKTIIDNEPLKYIASDFGIILNNLKEIKKRIKIHIKQKIKEKSITT